MPDGEMFRSPDERSGPAILDREPVLFPQKRKEVARKLRRKFR